jgi:hypothetical protein
VRKRLLTIALVSATGLAFAALAHGKRHHPPRTILAFDTMYGVDGPFLEPNSIRGVPGDEAPWVIAKAKGSLDSEGNLKIQVRGLVFKDDPLVQPPDLIGTNDEPEFRGLVSCLTEQGDSVVEANVLTAGFPASGSGDSFIHATVELPNPCVAPIVMVLAGSEEKWFAVTGFESEEEEEE